MNKMKNELIYQLMYNSRVWLLLPIVFLFMISSKVYISAELGLLLIGVWSIIFLFLRKWAEKTYFAHYGGS